MVLQRPIEPHIVALHSHPYPWIFVHLKTVSPTETIRVPIRGFITQTTVGCTGLNSRAVYNCQCKPSSDKPDRRQQHSWRNSQVQRMTSLTIETAGQSPVLCMVLHIAIVTPPPFEAWSSLVHTLLLQRPLLTSHTAPVGTVHHAWIFTGRVDADSFSSTIKVAEYFSLQPNPPTRLARTIGAHATVDTFCIRKLSTLRLRRLYTLPKPYRPFLRCRFGYHRNRHHPRMGLSTYRL